MNVKSVGLLAFVFLAAVSYLVYWRKKKKKIAELSVEVQIPESKVPDDSFEAVCSCSNCGAVVVRYLKKGTLIELVDCTKCGIKKVRAVCKLDLGGDVEDGRTKIVEVPKNLERAAKSKLFRGG